MANSNNYKVFGAETVDDLTAEQLEVLVEHEVYKLEQAQKQQDALSKSAGRSPKGRGRNKHAGGTVSIRTQQ